METSIGFSSVEDRPVTPYTNGRPLKAYAEAQNPWHVLLSAGLLNYVRFIEAPEGLS